jgi:polyhydroxyalkanoate synthesis regulator phasin
MSTETLSKKKVFAVAITTVALTVGSFGAASAAQKSTKVSRTSISTVSNPGQAGKPDRSAELSALLATLVSKGTITQAQADAVVAAAKSAEAARDALRPAKDALKGNRDAQLALIASTLGTDTKTVLTRLKAGESLATIAGAKKDALITALVADETKRIDAAVTAGKLTAAQATTLKANLVAHVTDEVNEVRPMGAPRGEMKEERGGKGGPMGGMKGDRGPGRGKGGPMGGAPKIPAPTPTATTASN